MQGRDEREIWLADVAALEARGTRPLQPGMWFRRLDRWPPALHHRGDEIDAVVVDWRVYVLVVIAG